jgi:hypothetical protein
VSEELRCIFSLFLFRAMTKISSRQNTELLLVSCIPQASVEKYVHIMDNKKEKKEKGKKE